MPPGACPVHAPSTWRLLPVRVPLCGAPQVLGSQQGSFLSFEKFNSAVFTANNLVFVADPAFNRTDLQDLLAGARACVPACSPARLLACEAAACRHASVALGVAECGAAQARAGPCGAGCA